MANNVSDISFYDDSECNLEKRGNRKEERRKKRKT